MPSKSKKVASKQTQIGQKKRRPKSPSNVPANDTPTDYQVAVESPSGSAVLDPTGSAVVSSPERLSSRLTIPRPVNRHVWSEIRYIGGLSLIVFIILGALTTVIG